LTPSHRHALGSALQGLSGYRALFKNAISDERLAEIRDYLQQ
jgi:hypothetical protein